MRHGIGNGCVILLIGGSYWLCGGGARADVQLEMLAQWGGPTRAVSSDDQYAYFGLGHRAVMVDLADPNNPVFVKQSDVLEGLVQGVATSGGYVFVAAEWAGLYVFDMHAAPDPILVGRAGTNGPALDVRVAGDYAFVAAGDHGLQVFRIATPDSPEPVGECDTPGDARDVAVDGAYAYVGDGPQGLQIIDVSDPTAPTLIQGLTLPDEANGVAVQWPYVCVAAGYNGGLQVVDVSDPENPEVRGACATDAVAADVVISGVYAYVANSWAGLAVVDISDSENLFVTGRYDTEGNSLDVALLPDCALVADFSRGLQVLHVLDPSNPSWAGEYRNATGEVTDLAAAGDLLYVTDGGGGGGVQVLDFSDLSNPVRRGGVVSHEFSWGMTHVGDYVYLADGCAGFAIVDVSNPDNPQRRGAATTSCAARDVVVHGDYAYVADDHQGLLVISVADVEAPELVGQYQDPANPGYALGVAVSGDYAYLANAEAGLEIIKITDPGLPTREGRYVSAGYVRDVALAGEYAYIASDWKGLEVIHISDPTDPTRVGGLENIGPAQSVTLAGSYAYLAAWDWGVQVVDITDPSAPVWAGNYNTAGGARRIDLQGDLLFVADMDNGVVVLSPLSVYGYSWINPDGGVFGEPTNWAPEGPPGPNAQAIFDLPDAYTVGFDSDYVNNAASIHDGTVSWDLGGLVYSLTGDPSLSVGPVAGGWPTLAASNGVLLAPRTLVAAGENSSAKLDLFDGAHAFVDFLEVGSDLGAQGHVAVSGSDSTLDVAQEIILGREGSAGMFVNAGSSVSTARFASLGVQPSSVGVVTVTDASSTWTFTEPDNALWIGVSGSGQMTVFGGGAVTNEIGIVAVFAGSAGQVTVTGLDAVWTNTNNLIVGREGAGTLLVTGGATVATPSLAKIGEVPGGHGVVTATGDQTTWAADTGDISVAVSGHGELHVLAGAHVNARGALSAVVAGSTGDMFVQGANSTFSTTGGLLIGREGTGTLVVEDGGSLAIGGWLDIGEQPGGKGLVTIQNTASVQVGGVMLARWPSSEGHILLTTPETGLTSVAQVQVGRGGTGEVTVSNGAHLTSYKATSATGSAGIIAAESAGTGVVTVTGTDARWDMPDGALTVGWLGSGSLSVEAQGVVETATDAIIGRLPGSTGQITVTGNGSLLEVGSTMSIGGLPDAAGGVGTLIVKDLGRVRVHSTVTLWDGGSIAMMAGAMAVGQNDPQWIPSTVAVGAGGVLKGTGTVLGNVQTTGGTLAPGSSTGILQIDGDWIQEVGGTLKIEIGGYTPGEDYDRLATTGAVQLGGRLEVTMIGEFVPTVGTAFDIVTYAAHTGDFDDIRPPTDVPGRRFEVRTGLLAVTLVTEPGIDVDGDGDVDLMDYSVLVGCMKGPGVLVSEGCAAADLDGDGDVDLGDFALFDSLRGGV